MNTQTLSCQPIARAFLLKNHHIQALSFVLHARGQPDPQDCGTLMYRHEARCTQEILGTNCHLVTLYLTITAEDIEKTVFTAEVAQAAQLHVMVPEEQHTALQAVPALLYPQALNAIRQIAHYNGYLLIGVPLDFIVEPPHASPRENQPPSCSRRFAKKAPGLSEAVTLPLHDVPMHDTRLAPAAEAILLPEIPHPNTRH